MVNTEAVDLLAQIVGIPSVNPEDTEDEAVTGEGRLAAFLADWFGARGFRVTCEGGLPGRPNLVARYGPETARWSILFEAHLDTVGVLGMEQPFRAVIRDGRLYGRGACDTKGPMAAAMAAFTPDVLEDLAEAGGTVIFAGAMGEEKGNQGAMELAAGGLGADEAIILEPTHLQVAHGHKGTLWLAVDTEGRAAHGSRPDEGCNAIDGMWDFLQAVRDDTAAAGTASGGNDACGPTLNIGTLRGGRAVNIVADRCTAEIDRRVAPGEDIQELLGRYENLLARVKASGAIRDYRMRVLSANPPVLTPPDQALVVDLLAAARAAGAQSSTEITSWYSDAGAFAATCRQVAVFGPGDIRHAHTAHEQIRLDELETGCEVFRRLLAGKAARLRDGEVMPHAS